MTRARKPITASSPKTSHTKLEYQRYNVSEGVKSKPVSGEMHAHEKCSIDLSKVGKRATRIYSETD